MGDSFAVLLVAIKLFLDKEIRSNCVSLVKNNRRIVNSDCDCVGLECSLVIPPGNGGERIINSLNKGK